MGERRSTPGLSKKMGRSGEGVSEKGEEEGRKGIFRVSFSSHSLPVSFPSRKILETPAKKATHSKAEKFEIRNHFVIATSSFSQIHRFDSFSFENADFVSFLHIIHTETTEYADESNL